MKQLALALAVTAVLSAPAAYAAWGVGFIVGEPTGLSLDFPTSPRHSIAVGAAWSFSEPSGFQGHVDYLWHRSDIHEEAAGLGWYLGLGARTKFRESDDASIGARIPVGLEIFVDEGNHLKVFGEVVPILDLLPDSKLSWNLAVGGRFYFH